MSGDGKYGEEMMRYRNIGEPSFWCPYGINEEECDPGECTKGAVLECYEWIHMELEGMAHEDE